jgi:hypothetical protein
MGKFFFGSIFKSVVLKSRGVTLLLPIRRSAIPLIDFFWLFCREEPRNDRQAEGTLEPAGVRFDLKCRTPDVTSRTITHFVPLLDDVYPGDALFSHISFSLHLSVGKPVELWSDGSGATCKWREEGLARAPRPPSTSCIPSVVLFASKNEFLWLWRWKLDINAEFMRLAFATRKRLMVLALCSHPVSPVPHEYYVKRKRSIVSTDPLQPRAQKTLYNARFKARYRCSSVSWIAVFHPFCPFLGAMLRIRRIRERGGGGGGAGVDIQ